MKKLFENWRQYRKDILNEQRPEVRALDRIEQNPERWSSSIEDARRAARQRAYGVTTSDRPLAASQESRQEEDWDQFIAGAAASSLLAKFLGPVVAAGLAKARALTTAVSTAPAGQVVIPRAIAELSPNAGAFMKWLFPRAFERHMIMGLSNIAGKIGGPRAVSAVYMLLFTTLPTLSRIYAIDSMRAWLSDRFPEFYDEMIKKPSNTINEIVADLLTDIIVTKEGTPEEVRDIIQKISELKLRLDAIEK